MTKRMLSLLLALVMTLSLCVPALAADEFAAEAVTEVEEQAPEAPEAPAAPEAEEPAEEPVVDEPAVEEAAADAPEMASVMPEDAEDLPYLVALGKVSKLSHYYLEKYLDMAKAYKARVDAGELYVPADAASITAATIVKDDTDLAKSFNTAYKEAQANMDGINGLEAGKDITEATVKAAYEGLKQFFPNDGSDDWTKAPGAGGSGENYLTDKPSADLAKLVGRGDDDSLKDVIYPDKGDNQVTYAKNWAKQYAGTSGSQDKTNGTITATVLRNTLKGNYKSDIFGKAPWTTAYKTEYLTAMKAVVDAAKAYTDLGSSATFKDFTGVIELAKAALKLEKTNAIPSSDDAAELNALITKVSDVKEADQDDYVGFSTDDVANAKNLLNSSIGGLNSFNDKVTYSDFVQAKADLEKVMIKKELSITCVKYTMDDMTKVAAIFGIPDKGYENDGHAYGYAYSVNGLYAKIKSKGSTEFDKDGTAVKTLGDNIVTLVNDNVNNVTKFAKTATVDGKDYRTVANAKNIVPIGTEADKSAEAGAKFSAKDEIVIYFFYQDKIGDDGDINWIRCGEYTIDLPSDGFTGAEIAKKADGTLDVAFASGDAEPTVDAPIQTASPATIEVKLTKNIDPETDGIVVKSSVGKELNPEYEVSDSAKPAAVAIASGSTSGDKVSIKLEGVEGITSPVTVELYVGGVLHSGTNAKATVNVETLAKWKSLGNAKAQLAAAKKLQKGDYELNKRGIGNRGDIEDYDDAWQAIQDSITTIEGYLNGSLVNTQTNRKLVADALTTLKTITTVDGGSTGYLKTKAVDKTDLQKAYSEAKSYKEDDYTYKSWGVLQDAIAKAEKAKLQSEVDDALAALNAAIAGLTKEGEVDKTALKAAIDSAKALKEADYTPESWAANKDAIDAAVKAAQAVVDNAEATAEQVTTALNTLNAAVGKLEKVGGEDEPPVDNHPAPANGTGWSRDKVTGEWYFYKNNKLVANYWVGKIDGASQWDSNWYYVGADGKMLTGMQYVDDLHGGYGWYFLQPTNDNQEIGKMLTGYQWVGGQYGECYFSKASGSSGKCTWSELLGNWNGTTWVK